VNVRLLKKAAPDGAAAAAPPGGKPAAPALEAPRREATFLSRLFRNKLAAVSGIYLVLLCIGAIFADQLTPYDPLQGNLRERMQPIGAPGHFLGTDEQGRDIWARIIFGARMSLTAALAPVAAGTLIGGALGIVSGYFGGRVETAIMRMLDVFYAFPAVLFAIALAAIIGTGLFTMILCMTLVFIPPIARVAMTAAKKVAHMEYVEAAKTSGAGPLSIIFRHVLRNVFSPILVYASTLLGVSMLMASGLSFLGLGVSPPAPEWGFMLNSLKDVIFLKPLITFVPGFFIFITSLAFNLLGDGIRDALNER